MHKIILIGCSFRALEKPNFSSEAMPCPQVESGALPRFGDVTHTPGGLAAHRVFRLAVERVCSLRYLPGERPNIF